MLSCKYIPGCGYQIRDSKGRLLTARYLNKQEAGRIMNHKDCSTLSAALLGIENTGVKSNG